MNRLDLGLCSKKVVLPGESQEAFDALLKMFIDEHQPESPTEDALVEEIAIAKWRLDRVRAAQTKLLATVDFCDLDEDDKLARKIANLHRYETQFRRQFDSALKLLIQTRAAADKARQSESILREREYKLHERRRRDAGEAVRRKFERHEQKLRERQALRNEPKPHPATTGVAA